MIRAKKIFGQDSILVISQKFHNERAVYIARRNGLIAYGFNARDVDLYNGFKTRLREFLSRDKVFFDEWIGTSPRHLGEPVPIR